MTRVLTASVKNSSGLPVAGVVMTFSGPLRPQGGAVVTGEPVKAVTDAEGQISLSLWPGEYSLSLVGVSRRWRRTFTLPEGEGAANLADLITVTE